MDKQNIFYSVSSAMARFSSTQPLFAAVNMEVPGQAQGVTNGAGEIVPALFPNELGSQGAVWQITVTTPLGTTIRAHISAESRVAFPRGLG